MKQGKQDYSKRDMIIGVVVLAGAAILAAIVIMPRMMNAATGGGSSAAPAAATSNPAGRLLSSGRGTGDEVSDDFTVPAGCTRQTITYDANSTGGFDGWVNFRVPYADGRGGESLGPSEVDDNPAGSGLWTLTQGIYAIEVTSWHANWSYELKCR